MSASPSLAASAQRLDAGRRAAPSPPGTRSPSTSISPSPISASVRCASGARSPDAPTEPCDGTYGTSPASCTASSVSITVSRTPECAAREARRLEREHQPHDRRRQRLADADAVRADQVELQRGEIGRARCASGELAEAGVDAVDRRVAAGGALHDGGAGADALARFLAERQRFAAAMDRLQLVERQRTADEVHAHSGLMFFFLMTSAQRAVSAWIVAARSCGVPPPGSRPSAANFSLDLGLGQHARALGTELVDDDGGRCRRHHQRIPGYRLEAGQALLGDGRQLGQRPASACRLATPIARSLPAWMCGSADGIGANIIVTCPPSRSLTAGAMPLYGTCISVDAGLELEQLAGEVRLAAGAGRREAELARLRLRERQQFLQRLRRRRSDSRPARSRTVAIIVTGARSAALYGSSVNSARVHRDVAGRHDDEGVAVGRRPCAPVPTPRLPAAPPGSRPPPAGRAPLAGPRPRTRAEQVGRAARAGTARSCGSAWRDRPGPWPAAASAPRAGSAVASKTKRALHHGSVRVRRSHRAAFVSSSPALEAAACRASGSAS